MTNLLYSLLLQSNELYEDVWWIAGAAIVLAIVFFVTKRSQHQQRNKRLGKNDPRQNVINDTSYSLENDKADGSQTDRVFKGDLEDEEYERGK